MRSQETETSNAARTRSDQTHVEEQLTLRNSGAYIYDPGLVTFSLGATLGLGQDWFTVDGDRTYSNADLSGYDAATTLLARQPFSLSLFANRSKSSLSRELAGRSEILTENRGGVLSAPRLYIPSTLTFRQEVHEEESRIASVVARRADRRNILRYEGQRGWTDSEIGVLYEFIDQSDQVFPDLSFQSHEGQVNYALDFGEELNRHWDSRSRHVIRTGFLESTTFTLDESLRIEHTPELRTDYRYFLLRSETETSETTTHTGSASLQHRLYESLTTTLGLDAVRQSLVQGETDTYRGRLDFAYTKRLPLGGRLTAGLGASLQYEDDRFTAAEAAISQETHTAATPFALPIALANPFAVASSVVVTKIAAGPLPIGCVPPPGPPTPLTLGVDYTLRTTGDVTEIVPIPCAGTVAGINPGDTIAVDYRFGVAPARTFTTEAWHADLGVDYRWIRVFASHEQSDQSLLAGRADHFLEDQRSDAVGGELRYDGSRLRASLLGEARRVRSTRLSYDTLRATALADFSIFADLMLRLSADQILTEYSDQDRETKSVAGRAVLTYALGASLFAELGGGLQRLEDSEQPTDQTTEARLLVRWRYRKIEVAPALEFFDRQRGETNAKEYRASMKVIRRF